MSGYLTVQFAIKSGNESMFLSIVDWFGITCIDLHFKTVGCPHRTIGGGTNPLGK